MDEIKSGRLDAEIRILLTDNPTAYALDRAKKNAIECFYLNPNEFISKDAYFAKISEEFRQREVELVILAGFLRIVRKPLLEAFPGRIMNIHPALLPSFPGLHAQKQALDYGSKITGCTVHFVDEGMDTGPIIIQAAVPVVQGDTEETLSARILEQEHKIYPEAIRLYAEGGLKIEGRAVRIAGYEL